MRIGCCGHLSFDYKRYRLIRLGLCCGGYCAWYRLASGEVLLAVSGQLKKLFFPLKLKKIMGKTNFSKFSIVSINAARD